MDNTIINVALHAIQSELGSTNSQLQWAVDSYILVYAALMFPAGILADQYGRKRVLLIGLSVSRSRPGCQGSRPPRTTHRVACGHGPGRGRGAVRDAVDHPRHLPANEQGKAMGVWSAIGGASVAVGPILGGLLLQQLWWGSVFLINVPIVLAAGALALWAVPESRSDPAARLDLLGIVLSALGTAALVFGVIRGGETMQWWAPDAVGLIALGVLVLTVFVLYERRRRHPTIDVSLFRNRAFASGTLSIALAFFTITGGTYLLVFYGLVVRGYTTLGFGLMLLPVALGSVIATIAASKLVTRYGPKLTVLCGLGFLAVAFAIMAFLDTSTPLIVIEAALFFAGLGMGAVMGTTTPLVMAVVPPGKAGAGAAATNAIRQIGAALGVAILGSVYATVYRGQMSSVLAPWTPPLPAGASESLGATTEALHVASTVPGLATALAGLLDQAHRAFLDAMQVTFLIALGVLALGMILGALWLPGRRSQAAFTVTPPSNGDLSNRGT